MSLTPDQNLEDYLADPDAWQANKERKQSPEYQKLLERQRAELERNPLFGLF